jgi:hypothetical protein
MVKRFGLVGVVALALAMQACTPSQLVTDLSAVVDAASVAVAFVPSLSPEAKAEIAKYLHAIAQASSETSVILDSGKLDAVTVARIVQLYTRIAVPLIPGVPAQVVAAIDAVEAAVSAFLGQIQPIQARTTTKKAIAFNRSDRATLAEINTKAARVVMDLQKAGF